jgi:hypothetical protein
MINNDKNNKAKIHIELNENGNHIIEINGKTEELIAILAMSIYKIPKFFNILSLTVKYIEQKK